MRRGDITRVIAVEVDYDWSSHASGDRALCVRMRSSIKMKIYML